LKKGGGGDLKPKAPKPLPPLTAEELAELPELPEGWGWLLIDVLLSLEKKPMATGPFGTLLSKSDHKSSGVPVLGIENIGNGVFVGGNKIFVSELKAKELESFRVEAGDIVISRSGTVGEICKIPEGLGKAFISTNLIRVSLNRKVINQDYFVYLFQGGGSVKQQVKSLCKGSSREFLNQTILSAISFPLPSIEEQRQIVDAIDAKFSIVDQLDQTITTSLQQAEALRQSILKKAFSGQLVPQDPHDEPASALLARIKTERATAEESSVVRKRSKRD
jgi:type I restriction enzyme S subunit